MDTGCAWGLAPLADRHLQVQGGAFSALRDKGGEGGWNGKTEGKQDDGEKDGRRGHWEMKL